MQAELPPLPGRVDIGGRRLHLLCSGGGAPTVVLEAGALSFAIDWTLVQRSSSHAALAKLSSNSRHSIVAGAGHEIHPFQMSAVITANGDVVRAVRERTVLPVRSP